MLPHLINDVTDCAKRSERQSLSESRARERERTIDLGHGQHGQHKGQAGARNSREKTRASKYEKKTAVKDWS